MTVQDASGQAHSVRPNFAFNVLVYTGYSAVTNGSGIGPYALPEGHHCFRADLSVAQFWTSEGNGCTVRGCETASMVVTASVVVTVWIRMVATSRVHPSAPSLAPSWTEA